MTLHEAPKPPPRPVRQRGADQLYAALAAGAVNCGIGIGIITWLAWGIRTIAGWLG
jgi:hypothetical protein